MPGFTARGYEYPLYTDAGHNFPSDIQALAEDIDADVQAQVNTLNGALDQPSARAQDTAAQVIAPNVDTTITWGIETFDNGGLFTVASPTIMTFSETGLYLISASAEWSGNANSTTSGAQLSIVSSVGGVRAVHGIRRGLSSAPATLPTEVHVVTLHAITVVGETISIVGRHNLPVNSQVTTREFSATKLSVDA